MQPLTIPAVTFLYQLKFWNALQGQLHVEPIMVDQKRGKEGMTVSKGPRMSITGGKPEGVPMTS